MSAVLCVIEPLARCCPVVWETVEVIDTNSVSWIDMYSRCTRLVLAELEFPNSLITTLGPWAIIEPGDVVS